MHTFELNIKDVSKIEGKASLSVKVRDDKLEDLKFSITEFKRFYTAALKGKDVLSLPQLSARICGTCSNAHLLCAIKAAEAALKITPSPQTMLLRKLLNYGLNIRDHGLHLYVFVLPDLFGKDNILDFDEANAQQHELLHDTFNVKAAGNHLGQVIGGRSVHAPYPTVGGFTKLPDPKAFPKLIAELKNVRPAVLRLIDLFVNYEKSLPVERVYLALIDKEFSFLEGEFKDSLGNTISVDQLPSLLKHQAIPYSQASGYTLADKTHVVGALARLNLNQEHLHPRTQADTANALKLFPSNNIFHNNLAQAIEILHAVDSSIEILSVLQLQFESEMPILPIRKAGTGYATIEAPRGTLFYRLNLNDKGIITDVQIVVPTGHNQIGIEQALKTYFTDHLEIGQDRLINEAEQIVRAYDPCMSCASHFLKVKWSGNRK